MQAMRNLNGRGEEVFTDYINRVKAGALDPPPISDLGKSPYSTELTTFIEVPDEPPVSVRLGLGKYLVDLFEANGIQRGELLGNSGLWSWLALVWFDKLCQIDTDSLRKPGETSRYVCSNHYTDYYRHLVASSWDIYYLYKEKARLFLWTPLYIHNDFMEQLASRQDIITNKPLVDVFDRLYWNTTQNRPKRGAQSRNRSGNFRRLLQFIQQVDLTYDSRAMKAEEILDLLPSEYSSWKV